ncbi:hypothetical protein FLK61_30220 [Paenalkalicoccus suaedae]|uniref:Ligand-binding SRPBCC domain-containing protein n=1 Tax=Paenalkalicoccus suaedae TaxID=2592382 RepID=A0A859FD50_9BACI|nr:hypothetical protein [Paenalkalicoccus suaedae]QKS70997.1 hypothetical protein FLK61_30220 [Paenalkalicoccus suaedae]
MFSGTFYFKTEINKPIKDVWEFFQTNENLVAITGFPKITLLGDKDVFEGSHVHLKMDFFLVKLDWQGEITKVVPEAYFMDEGKKLPFPFKEWRHVHAFKELSPSKTKMIDRVEFSSYVPAPLIKAMLIGMFSDRKRQLKKYL